MPNAIDHHIVAIAGLGGVLCELLGGLYLAYDLFGGPNGPLRTLTEVITYMVAGLFVSIGSYIVLYDIITYLHFRIEVALGSQATLGGVLGLGIGSGLGAGLGYSSSLRVHRRAPPVPKPRSGRQRLAYACLVGAVTGLFGIGIFLTVTVSEKSLHSFTTAFA